ncbi:TRAP transporter substrate-binding protein [Limoniibacter endophyticus]|uniref:ABC transporter substrate-binding protein n=1 Tax=Limoniibacter endophyticus TaxID=1565040 RepID=A0A8J3GGZ2_9HYPH|nr:DctP family TRAP transporter solute-binding subunit [Limoniibacter endophyticus]GHC75585.1 ABC transporter substrate-binding protein [Limoniibacter endophyticus]
MELNRRTVLKGLAAAPAAVTLFNIGKAQAAEHNLRYGHNLPLSHPLHIRAQEAADRIAKETDGKVQLQIFPSNQLGGDTDMLQQVRNGAITFFTPSSLVISTLVPVASINAVGFAFKDYEQVWAAMDGPVGDHIRDEIKKPGQIEALDVMWDNGFRQITNSGDPITDAKDMAGIKIRVPVAPLMVDMFRALDAAPAAIQFSEVYTALQTKTVDAQENPLPIISVAKLYEVQKNCAVSNHIWDGYWFIANSRQLNSLPDDLRSIVTTSLNEAGKQQRNDIKALNEGVRAELEKNGMTFNEVDTESFRAKLREAKFYSTWKEKFGEAAWGHLEGVVGQLA